MTTDTTPAEAMHRPTTTYRPRLLAWPEAFAPLLAEYDETHRAWSQAICDLHEALARVPAAEREDVEAFERTVREGSRPDTRGRATRARLDVDAAVIRTAAARETATASTDRLKQAIRDDAGDTLVPAAIQTLRGAADDYSRAHEEARGTLTTAAARLRTAAGLGTLLAPALDAHGLGVPQFGAPERSTLPADPTAAVRGRLDRLEADWLRARTATTTRTTKA